jgi:hypothetical protein
MAPSGQAYNVDWIIASSTNVHVANNRDWFTSYTPFVTHVDDVYFNSRMEVLGIGDVQLKVRLHKQRRGGQPNSRIIVLHDVLYAPKSVCNIIGFTPVAEYNAVLDYGERRGYLEDNNGKRAGLVEIVRLPRLRLHGQCAETTSLGDAIYLINAHWPATERAGWEAAKASVVIPCNGDRGDALYSAEEKAWLKTHYDGEFKFLRVHGLSIYKEEDRDDGRSIARAMMKLEW